MANGFWEMYDQAVREESGGGGIIGFTTVQLGFKVYVAGVAQEETFFPVTDISSQEAFEADRAKRKSEAQAFGQSHGASRGPQFGIQIRVRKEGAFSSGKPAEWAKGDRFFNVDAWTDSAKEVVRPSIDKMGISLPWSGWARIGFAPNPNEVKAGTMKDVDRDGNPRYHQVAYLTEVFPNEAAAHAAVGSAADTPDDIAQLAMGDAKPSYPDGWDESSWNDVVADVKVQSLNPALSRRYLKDTYDVDLALPEVVKLLK